MSSRPLSPSGPPRVVWTVLVFALGFLLVANGAYLFPEGGEAGRRYVYESHAANDAGIGELPDGVAGEVVDCNHVAVGSRTCAVVRHVRTEGPLRVETDADLGPTFADYRFVAANGSAFRPTARIDGGTLVLGLDRIAPERARRALATEYDDVGSAARTAVNEGRVRTAAPIPADERYVVRSGSYYVIERDRMVTVSARAVWPLRLAG
ncbi:MAG: hypothetical protein ABEH58_08560 [Haloplanus sp.]